MAPQEVWAPLASEDPLGKMGSVEKREQPAKEGAQGRRAPEGILGLPGCLEQGKTENRDSVDHLAYLDLSEPRGTEAYLGSLALLATVGTRASGLLAPLAPLDHQETKDPRDLEAYLGSPAPRDQLARMECQETQEKEGPLASRAPLRGCLQRTYISWLRTCAVIAPQGPQASLACQVLKGTKASQESPGETAQRGERAMPGPEVPQVPRE